MKLVMLRHGATAGNEAHCYVGKRTDEPLSETGRRQCHKMGCDPSVKKVYASPLKRAQQTAHVCFPHARIETVAGLEEFDFGIFEGRTADEMANDADYRAWVDSGCTALCPGGDSRATYMQRSNDTLVQLIHDAAQHGEDQVIVVAHGGTIMAAFSAFACPDEAQDYFSWQVKNAQGYTAQVDSDGTTPVFSNCTPLDTLPL